MTCIVAVAQDGKVVMGGDSAAVDTYDYSLGTCVETKVWQNGPVMFGACGSFRVSQLIRWKMTLPTPDPDCEPLAYLVDPLAEAMRNTLAQGGALTTWQEDSTEELTASGLLIGFAGRVFEIFSDFGVGELVEGYGAVGCGALLALGSLASTEGQKPLKRVRVALSAAERHSAGVQGPFEIIKG